MYLLKQPWYFSQLWSVIVMNFTGLILYRKCSAVPGELQSKFTMSEKSYRNYMSIFINQ